MTSVKEDHTPVCNKWKKLGLEEMKEHQCQHTKPNYVQVKREHEEASISSAR
jgi:hypothetical protein